MRGATDAGRDLVALDAERIGYLLVGRDATMIGCWMELP
jgi:hypothetical protein